MKKSHGKIFLSLLLFTFFSIAIEARADTVVINSGSITFDSKSINNTFSLTGDGLSIQGRTGFLFLGNSLIDLDFGVKARLGRELDNDDFSIQTPFIAGGIEYFDWQNMDDAFLLNISAAEFALPLDPSIPSLTFSSTFTLNGKLNLRRGNGPNSQLINLTGTGIATAVYSHDKNFPSLWHLQSLNYTFQPTPTPEPTTLLLLGTGIAGVAAKVYRRRRGRKEE